MYELIGTTKSRAFRPLWMLEELGVTYTHTVAKPHADAARAHSATGKIPILVVEGVAVPDSVAIMGFLADRHDAFSHPVGSVERALQDAMTNRLNDELDAVLWAAAKHTFMLPEQHRVPEVKASLRWEFARSIAKLEADFGKTEYLAGEAPTVPDFLLTHCLGWAGNAKFEFDAPKLEALADKMRARPAFGRARALA